MGKRKTKIINVDFQKLERTGYAGASKLGREIIDKMIEVNKPKEQRKTPRDEAREDIVHIALKELTERQCQVIKLTFGFYGEDPLSTRQISEKLKISSQAVSEVKRRAFRKLQNIITLNQDALKNIKNN